MIGPLPPGLYKVAAEVQEAGCSILTGPIPLDGATQRRHTAWLPILVVAAQGSAVADGPAAPSSERSSERADDRVAPWRISTLVAAWQFRQRLENCLATFLSRKLPSYFV